MAEKECLKCIHKCVCKTAESCDGYVSGCKHFKEGWISVKDRLPENDQWVLCFVKDKSFGTFRVFQWNYIDWQWNDGNEWYDEYDITHWMPLPKQPKGE